MNEKITNLIQELAIECVKEDAGLSLSVVRSNGEVAIANVGRGLLVAVGVLQQYEQAKEIISQSTCDCENCTALRKKFESEEEKSEGTPDLSADDPEEMFAQLMRHLRGDLR